MSDFVKSATTSTPVAKSQADIIAMLGRYGASGFGFRRIGDVIEVRFHLPRVKGDDTTVAIPVNVAFVRAKLDSPAMKRQRQANKQATSATDEQAERVGWRVLHLWIDAALAAVSLGAQTIEEAFFAHLVVTTDEGQQGRMVEYVASLAAPGVALPSPRRLALGPGPAVVSGRSNE